MANRRRTVDLSQKEHAEPDFLIQHIVHTARIPFCDAHWDIEAHRTVDACFLAKNDVAVNHKLFMNDQGRNRRGLQTYARKLGSDGRIQGKMVKSSGNAHAFAEGVFHWIDVIEFSFLFYLLLP